jgi:hypothetical protein
MIILAAFFVVSLLKSNQTLFLKRILIFLLLVTILFGSSFIVMNKTEYNSLMRIQKADVEAMDWIKMNTSDETIFLASPGVGNGDWGSFQAIVTGREFIDGGRCEDEYFVSDFKCSFFYDLETEKTKDYFKEQEIDYVYSGKRILGAHHAKDRIDWTYDQGLKKANYLIEVAEFKDKNLGSVVIYEVQKDKL